MKMKVGDQVWLEGKDLQVIGSRKLLPKWYGPFVIMDQTGGISTGTSCQLEGA
jgi:hypothetical protein